MPRKARPSKPVSAPPTKLYLAYGSNLDKEQMGWRCPEAEAIGTAYIDDMRLVFRRVADIEPCAGERVPVGVWRITPACEAELDLYEGYRPGNRGLYRKEVYRVTVETDDGSFQADAMAYVMNSEHYGPPARPYFQTIARGYRDFGLPGTFLEAALDATLEGMDSVA